MTGVRVQQNGGLQDSVVKETMPKAQSKATPGFKKATVRSDIRIESTRKAGPLKSPSASLARASKVDDMDVFDIPSDDEAPAPSLEISRRPVTTKPTQRPQLAAKKAKVPPVEKETAESDDSNTSKKRKRSESISSLSSAKPALVLKSEVAVPQRTRKHQKRDADATPALESLNEAVESTTTTIANPRAVSSHQPRRNRVRTVPVMMRPGTKGISSPARLSDMVASNIVGRSDPREDETLYDIGNDSARTPKSPMSGSVTPRQKALFSSLLGDTTPMPRLSSLQLTDRKPAVPSSISRSQSDLSYSAQSRKVRLIDAMKRANSSSEDEDDDDTSENSDVESEASGSEAPLARSGSHAQGKDAFDVASMDLDTEVADSQLSQQSAIQGSRPRFTYAKERSHLQETNLDAAFLMDIDDNLGLDSQSRDEEDEEDEDPMSQVRAHHELKSQGQQNKFHFEAEMSIDDLSRNAGPGVRRSAMMELCTRMEDPIFTGQLLDSTLSHRFFKNTSSNGEIVFDFASAVAVNFILQTKPAWNVLDQLRSCGIIPTLLKLVDNDIGMRRIVKDRKTNLSKIAQESVATFCTMVENSSIWGSKVPVKITPQIVALRAIDELVVNLREANDAAMPLDQGSISKLVALAERRAHSLHSAENGQDSLIVGSIVSMLEAVSAARTKQAIWPASTLQQLAQLLPVSFVPEAAVSPEVAMKLCMNLTNNKPKACEAFSGPTFVQAAIKAIMERFKIVLSPPNSEQEQRKEAQESLILCLGTMINLAEFNDVARSNVDDDKQIVARLVATFLDGSQRAAQADSMEESESNVAIGFLAVLLGNLCLNRCMRQKIRSHLPYHDMNVLTDQIKEFIHYHKRVDSKLNEEFEGVEGQETMDNYTARLMHVVEKLEKEQA